MVLELILTILVEFVKDPINQHVVKPIGRSISYSLKCDGRVQTLQDNVVQLKNKKDRLQQSVDAATRNGEEIYPNVTEWLSNAERAIEEAEKLLQLAEEAKNKCFVGLCPDFKTRYGISKKAVKKTREIHELREEGGLDPISFCRPPQQIIHPPSDSGESLSSRVSVLEQIMAALRDPNINMIGVYGMGGIGKTTLAKEVQKKALQEKLFETVVLVAVSQTPELRRIQGEIAGFLGMNFDCEEIPVRASQLYKRLENSKVLIILDDLWQKLDMDAVGIPSRGVSKDCKIMLTSRNMNVLGGEMHSQKLFPVETLQEEEALRLLLSIAEPNDPNLHAMAPKIAEKCGGLPLLIDIVATQLKNQEFHVWQATLNQLSTFGSEEIHEKVNRVLKSSYDDLPGTEMKPLFLLCSLLGQSNIQIQRLLIYSLGLGLLKGVRTIEDARNGVLTLIDKLKSRSLLLEGDMAGCIKMHDVVRDTALQIASSEDHAFIGASEVRSSDWPNEDSTRISLPFCNTIELPLRMDCPVAELFLLFTEDLSLKIADSFFDGNRKLKVVDFTGMRMVPLPPSIGFLTSLQTLCLHKCRLDDVAVIGKLKQLEQLSFAGSMIVELPRELEALTRLKLLDLRDCSNLQRIPVNLFSGLRYLEELYMLNSFVRWGAKDNASLVEMENLARISTLEIQIPYPDMIPKGLKCFSQLRQYKISIGQLWDWSGRYDKPRTLKLKVERGVHLEDCIESLLKRSEHLHLDGGWGIESLFNEGFSQLKNMHFENDFHVQYLTKSTTGAFPMLESLYLNKLHSLEKMCCGQLPMGSFGKLRTLKITSCDNLTSLLPFSSRKCLEQLRELEVESCENMESVFGEGFDDDEVMEFTQFSSLKLKNLPRFTGFCKSEAGSEQFGLLFRSMVSFPNLTSLEVRGCKSLKYIFTVPKLKCLKQLKQLKIEYCELLEEIIQSKKMEEIEGAAETIVFPELDSLILQTLVNLKRFSSCCWIEFPLLRELRISYCPAMGNFVGRVSNKERAEEYLFNEMVTFSNLERMHIGYMNCFKYLWGEHFIAGNSFSKLKSISIESCSKLAVVFPSKICTRFQRVESLSLSYCDGVEEIFPQMEFKEIANAFSLRDLQIHNLASLKHIWNEESEQGGAVFTFRNLQSVDVGHCNNLKYVFPARVGCGLPQLQQLTLRKCSKLEVVIAKERDDQTSDLSLQFPELRELKLEDLKEMRSLCEGGSHTFDCPKLKSLDIAQCSKISVDNKFICNLEGMTIDEYSFHTIHHSADVSVELCTKLKRLTLINFNKPESTHIALSFLSGIRWLEILVFELSSLELQYLQRLRVKHLHLERVKKLKHVTEESSQHLRTLKIFFCDDLINIAPSSISLQNLTTLYLSKCDNVTNLVTASTAKTMVHLTEMEIVRCHRIKEIIVKDGDSTEHEVITFNKLKHLELYDLPNVNSFCSDMYSISFPLLVLVTIKGCPRMNVFCGGEADTPELRGILFEDEKQWEGDLNLTISSQLRTWVGKHLEDGRVPQNLESVELVNNTVSSTALSAIQMEFLNKLRSVAVRDCDSVQVVFDLEGDVERLPPKLKKLKLTNLPMLTQLCNKSPSGILDFSRLIELKIEKCNRLVYAFTWSMASCLSRLEEVKVKNCEMMETLIVDDEDVASKAIRSSLVFIVLVNMPKFSSIYSGRGELECPSLLIICIRECPSIKGFISAHIHFAHRVFPKLYHLLMDMESIRGMGQFEAPIHLFSSHTTLMVFHCSASTKSRVSLFHFLSRFPNFSRLKIHDSSFKLLLNSDTEEPPTVPPINSSSYQSASFQNVVHLSVCNCNQLMNLMTPPVAKNMVQLQYLTVESCERMVEIIGDGSHEIADEIVFNKLRQLELIRMPSLKGFSLTHCNFNFPCLDRVAIRGCPNLGIFCNGNLLTPMLKYNLNTTTKQLNEQMVGFDFLERIKFSAFPVLKEKWEARIPNSFTRCLERLEVDCCENITNAIPSHVLEHLEGLKVLIVEKCNSVEHVIELEGLSATDYGIIPMRNLLEMQLIDLPRLKQVWSNDPQHILSFENLQILKVSNCGSLTFIFDLSMALSLQNLQHMEVKNCQLVEHIIVIVEGETMQEYQTIFPSLQSLALQHLTRLQSFCSVSEALGCPSLKMIELVDCPNVDLFASSNTVEDPNSVQALFGNKIVIPGLEELKVEWRTLKDEFYHSVLFSRLKCIELVVSPSEEYASLPFTSLRHFLQLEKLALSDSSIEEIILDDLRILKDEDPESLALLSNLKLSKLPKLKHLVSDDSQVDSLLQHLKGIEVVECSSLKTLVPPSVAFHNLTDLEVSKCDGLINLISAPTARSLVQLRRMKVKDCKLMREIVAVASDGEEYEIRFSQVQYLELDGLPCLESFSSGKCDFHFPSLEEVIVTECPNMKNFAAKVSVSQKLRKVRTGPEEYDWEWEGTLNATIQAIFSDKDVEEITNVASTSKNFE